MRIAFFGGSFDPPHEGHLAVARAAMSAVGLDSVLFAPVALQPLKPAGASASYEDRVEMIRLAIAADPGFQLSLIDSPSDKMTGSPNYTAETLIRLRSTLGDASQLFLLLGADNMVSLPQWHRAAEIPFLARLIVASRPGEDISDLAACLPQDVVATASETPNLFILSNSNGDRSELVLLPNLHYDISATQLRAAMHAENPEAPRLIPAAVLNYIHEHKLYK